MAAHRLRVLAWPLHAQQGENPYIDLLYGAIQERGDTTLVPFTKRRLATGSWDIVHVHWPEWAVSGTSALRSALDGTEFVALLQQARLRGTRVVWTAHDLRPHDLGSASVGRFMRLFSRQVDYIIGLSEASLHEVDSVYPWLRSVDRGVVVHGHYREAYRASGLQRGDARARLQIQTTGRLLHFLGQIRPYKNIEELVRCFRLSAGDDDRLVVAGRPVDDTLAGRIRAAAEADPRVTLRLEVIDDADIPVYLSACDAMILPYRSILNSGAALLGLSFDRPVIVPAMGSLTELRDRVGADWVRTYSGPLTTAVVTDALRSPLPSGQVPLDEFDWGRVADATVSAYHAALGRPPRWQRWLRSPLRSRAHTASNSVKTPCSS